MDLAFLAGSGSHSSTEEDPHEGSEEMAPDRENNLIHRTIFEL